MQSICTRPIIIDPENLIHTCLQVSELGLSYLHTRHPDSKTRIIPSDVWDNMVLARRARVI